MEAVLTALVAVASATISKEEKETSVSKSKDKFKLPYISKKFSLTDLPIVRKTPSITKSKTNSLNSSNQATPPVSKTEDITQVPAIKADAPKGQVKPSLSITVDEPQYAIAKEKSPVANTQITPPASKIEAIAPIPATNADTPIKEASATVPETQARYYTLCICLL